MKLGAQHLTLSLSTYILLCCATPSEKLAEARKNCAATGDPKACLDQALRELRNGTEANARKLFIYSCIEKSLPKACAEFKNHLPRAYYFADMERNQDCVSAINLYRENGDDLTVESCLEAVNQENGDDCLRGETPKLFSSLAICLEVRKSKVLWSCTADAELAKFEDMDSCLWAKANPIKWHCMKQATWGQYGSREKCEWAQEHPREWHCEVESRATKGDYFVCMKLFQDRDYQERMLQLTAEQAKAIREGNRIKEEEVAIQRQQLEDQRAATRAAAFQKIYQQPTKTTTHCQNSPFGNGVDCTQVSH